MSNRRPNADAAELDQSGSARSLRSVADDFAALAAVFDRQLGLIPASDKTTRSHLRNAKAAAERGLHLSNELLKRLQSAGGV